jgi:capsular polysaccharide transport system permease protein
MKISVKRYNTRRTESVPKQATAMAEDLASQGAMPLQAANSAGPAAPSFAAEAETAAPARPEPVAVSAAPADGPSRPVAQTPMQLTQAAARAAVARGSAQQSPSPYPARPTSRPAPGGMLFDPPEDGFGDMPFPTSAAAQALSADPNLATPQETGVAGDIDAIRREGLTGRQLRMARRMAQKYGLPATSDFDAVRLLRGAGIDPFQKGSMLDIIAAEDEEAEMASSGMDQGAGASGPNMRGTAMVPVPGDGVRLPQTIKPAKLPATPQVQAEQSHLAELSRIQQDLVRRRRRNGMLMILRLIFFVALPTLLAGIYYYNIATPLYATKTEFVIQQADPSSSSGGGGGGLLGGRGGAAGIMQDPIIVQSYLQSREAMLRLDETVNFRDMFSNPTIDPIQRLEAAPSDEATYKVYLRNVRIAFDPTEGVIKMEVIAPSPEASVTMSKALLGYAEEQVDQLTLRVREDQMKGARENYLDAEQGVKDAQRKVVELQRRYNVLSSEAEVDMVTSQIASLEAQLTKDRLGLAQMESNANPNVSRMEPLKRRIATMESQIAEMRTRLTKQDINGNESLAEVQSEMLLAEADVKTRQEILSKSLEAMESARIAANQQVRYLSVGVPPIPPDEPTYPRAFENTTVALLIFAGIYLMISMTAAILREQITA